MKLFVTGATGVIGSEALPRLLADGHRIHAVARTAIAADRLVTAGVRPVQVDLFDPVALRASLHGLDGIIHLATAIPPLARMHRPRAWRDNDRLRDEATRNLVDAAVALDLELVVFPSITFNYADGGAAWLDEEAAVAPPFAPTASALAAEAHLARFTAAGGRGVVLRLARLYGPGRASAEQLDHVRAGRAITVGHGDNFVSSLHRQDAGSAVAASVTAPAGTYNVADDAPARAWELDRGMAQACNAREPRRVPALVARLAVGRATNLLTVSQRVSNRRFRTTTGWSPAHPDAVAWWHRSALRAVVR